MVGTAEFASPTIIVAHEYFGNEGKVSEFDDSFVDEFGQGRDLKPKNLSNMEPEAVIKSD